MDTQELKEKLDIIFNKELYNVAGRKEERRYRPKSKFKETYLDTLQDSLLILSEQRVVESSESPVLFSRPEAIELDYPNLNLLIKLYASISHDKTNVDFFINYLKECFNPMRNNSWAAHLALETLLKLGYWGEAFTSWREHLYGRLMGNMDSRMLIHLSQILKYEYPYLDERKLSLIRSVITQIPNSSKVVGILGLINEIKYTRLKSELEEGINLFQINEDRRTIEQKLRKFGFSDTLDKALNKIEEYYWSTATDEFDYSSAIGKLREFYTQLVEEICLRIKNRTTEEYPTDEKTRIANLRKYMKKHLQLKEDENKLISALVEIINKKGSHALISDKEYFRLTKNMMIEITLLLLTRLEKFLQK